MKKGYVLTWDVMVALTLVIIVFVGFLSLPYFNTIGSGEIGFKQIHLKSEDAIEVLSKKGTLAQIGMLWAEGDATGASDLAKSEFDAILPKTAGYQLEIEGNVVYDSDADPSSERPRSENAKDKTRAIRFISGFSENEPISGWAARAVLFQNLTGDITQLYYGDYYSVVNLTLNDIDETETAYLVIPLGAEIYHAEMDISWDPDIYPNCL